MLFRSLTDAQYNFLHNSVADASGSVNPLSQTTEMPIDRFPSNQSVPEAIQQASQQSTSPFEQSVMNNPPPNVWPAGSPPPPEPTGIMGAFDKAIKWAKEHPWSAASMGMNAMRFLGGGKDSGSGGPEPYTGILTKYKLSPDFKGRYARPEDYQYTPRRYAGGGPEIGRAHV